MSFPRLEYWSGLPFPLLEDLPVLRIEPMSAALAGGFFTLSHHGSPVYGYLISVCQMNEFLTITLRDNTLSDEGFREV